MWPHAIRSGYWHGLLILLCTFGTTSAQAEPDQVVEITIQQFTFRASQLPLKLDAPTIIRVTNRDGVPHDFQSSIFHDTLTHAKSHGATVYSTRIDGAIIEPGETVTFSFILHRPGEYHFHCSIHPDMKGEVLLMSAGAA